MGVIADALAAAAKPEQKACSVVRAVEKFREDEDFPELIAAINNPDVSAVALARVMNQLGVRLDRRRLLDHRNNACCCTVATV